jgi:hypothetical protein
MSIAPTCKEWLAARERLSETARDIPITAFPGELDRLTEAAMGCPCPLPPYWRTGQVGGLMVTRHAESGVWVGFPLSKYEKLTSNAADEMATAVIEHARYDSETPALPTWRYESLSVASRTVPYAHQGVWVGFPGKHEELTLNEAISLAASLTEHAAYVRETEEQS